MGGPSNPPDKPPGYKVVTLPSDDDQASNQLTAARALGYKLVAFDAGRAILEDYRGEGNA